MRKTLKRFFHKLLKELTCVRRVIITDKLASCGAAMRELMSSVEHRQHRYLDNGAENSRPPTRQWKRRMKGFTSHGLAQQLLATYGPIARHFRPRRYRLSTLANRQEIKNRFQNWREITSLPTVAESRKRGSCISCCQILMLIGNNLTTPSDTPF
jgi:putative transposase